MYSQLLKCFWNSAYLMSIDQLWSPFCLLSLVFVSLRCLSQFLSCSWGVPGQFPSCFMLEMHFPSIIIGSIVSMKEIIWSNMPPSGNRKKQDTTARNSSQGNLLIQNLESVLRNVKTITWSQNRSNRDSAKRSSAEGKLTFATNRSWNPTRWRRRIKAPAGTNRANRLIDQTC